MQAVLIPSGRARSACNAFVALADVLDLLVAVPLGQVTPQMLRQSIRVLLESCVTAGWRTQMHPKFHWLVHLPNHLDRFGCLPTCWVHERKHRMVKRYAGDICNTGCFEKSVFAQVTSHHLASLTAPLTFSTCVGIVAPKVAPRAMTTCVEQYLGIAGLECTTGLEARVSKHEICCAKDVVLLLSDDGSKYVAGQVWFHAAYAEEPCSLVSIWTLLSADENIGSAEWQEADNPVLVTMQ